MPPVVLVGGSGPTDRDGVVFGIPVLGQIADAIAEAGFVVVRYDKRGLAQRGGRGCVGGGYDKRGMGQRGGRAESAGLNDYGEDARAAVKFLADRPDVDPK